MGEFKQRLRRFLSSFKATRRDRNSMKLIKWSTRFLLFCLTLYIIMTFYEWLRIGHPDLAEFRQFVVVVGGLTGTFTVLSRWLVDEDKDGIPDVTRDTPFSNCPKEGSRSHAEPR